MKNVQPLVQLLYVSRHASTPEQLPSLLRGILDEAMVNNQRRGITGLLAAIGPYFLQLLEGPPVQVDRLVERISKDPRHRDMRVLVRSSVVARLFPTWSMAILERASDALSLERARLDAVIQTIGRRDGGRLLRALCFPTATVGRDAHAQMASCSGEVVICGPGTVWAPALLNALATEARVGVYRTSMRIPSSERRSALIEHADLPMESGRFIRAVVLTEDESHKGFASLLLERPTLVIVVLSSSDARRIESAALQTFLPAWVQTSNTPVLFVCQTSEEVRDEIVAKLGQLTASPVAGLIASARDAKTIWVAIRSCMARPERQVQVGADGQALRLHADDASSYEQNGKSSATTRSAIEQFLASIDGGLAVVVSVSSSDGIVPVCCSSKEGLLPESAIETISLLRLTLLAAQASDEVEEIAINSTATVQYTRLLCEQPSIFMTIELKREGETLPALRFKVQDFAQRYLSSIRESAESDF